MRKTILKLRHPGRTPSALREPFGHPAVFKPKFSPCTKIKSVSFSPEITVRGGRRAAKARGGKDQAARVPTPCRPAPTPLPVQEAAAHYHAARLKAGGLSKCTGLWKLDPPTQGDGTGVFSSLGHPRAHSGAAFQLPAVSRSVLSTGGWVFQYVRLLKHAVDMIHPEGTHS